MSSERGRLTLAMRKAAPELIEGMCLWLQVIMLGVWQSSARGRSRPCVPERCQLAKAEALIGVLEMGLTCSAFAPAKLKAQKVEAGLTQRPMLTYPAHQRPWSDSNARPTA